MPDYRKLVIKITKKQQIQEEKLMDYKNSGVDIEAGYKSVELMKKYVQGTMRPEVLTGLGGFSGAFSMEKFKNMEKPTLVSGTDGVGTKLKLAFLMDKHDTIGIDCVAMCVNDIACAGGEPLFFLDYIACGKNYPEKIAAIVSGVAEGCKQSDAALIGGETAEHPGLMPEDEYDLAGFAVGVVDEKDIITGADVKAGDVLIGMASSGVHSNGFSLVRKIFEMTKESLDTYYDELGKTLGEALLAPTRIYVKALRSVKEAGVRIKACSHITGGGFYENVPRMLPEGKQAVIRKDSYEVPSIFKLMAKKGQVEEKMMYNTYNMGLGMVLAVDPADVDKTMEAIKAAGETPYVVGEIKDGEKGVTLC
jgi:phosphoribosylformylglycinamidine cyclo-ligase